MSVKYNYNCTGEERKRLAQAVSQILEEPVAYLGAPTFAYAIGAYRINRNGSLFSLYGSADGKLARLVSDLQALGYAPLNPGSTSTESHDENVSDCPTGFDSLVVEIPKIGFTEGVLDNLHKIISSKRTLLKKALRANALPVIDAGETLRFPWFTLYGLEGEADAYSSLVAAICKMAKERKRITAKERDSENDKLNMRLFLVQLGFIGDEYKSARKILLRNLTGNSSWKSGHAPEQHVSATENTDTTSNLHTDTVQERGEQNL